MRSALAQVPKGQQSVVAAALRQAFLQADQASARQIWRQVADQLRPRWPRLASLMDESEHDVLACMGFPIQHRTKLHSTDEIDKGFSARPCYSSPARATAWRTAGQRLEAPPGCLITMTRPRVRHPCASWPAAPATA